MGLTQGATTQTLRRYSVSAKELGGRNVDHLTHSIVDSPILFPGQFRHCPLETCPERVTLGPRIMPWKAYIKMLADSLEGHIVSFIEASFLS